MHTPDKIYVSSLYTQQGLTDHGNTHGLWYDKKSDKDADIEYIRKDELLEWAKSEIDKDEYVLTLEDLIEKLNSM